MITGGAQHGVRGHFIRRENGDIAWLRLGGRLYRRAD
jgi:hypothetical protein